MAVSAAVLSGLGTAHAAEAHVTVSNGAEAPIMAVMTESPSATVLSPWPRTLAAGEDLEAAFSFPRMAAALSMVQYALPPDEHGDSRTCLFRWRTDPREQVRCTVVLTAQRIGVGEASCSARLLEQDTKTCAFRAVFEVR